MQIKLRNSNYSIVWSLVHANILKIVFEEIWKSRLECKKLPNSYEHRSLETVNGKCNIDSRILK